MMKRNPRDRPSADAIINRAEIQAVVRVLLGEATAGKDSANTKVKHEVMDQFQKFDQNGDGVVDRQELVRVLKHLDASVWTDAAIGQIMLVADTNRDGRIQLDEFIQWVFGSSDGAKGVAARVEQQIGLCNLAMEHEDVDELREQVQGWRQYVDMGCLRVSPPEASIK